MLSRAGRACALAAAVLAAGAWAPVAAQTEDPANALPRAWAQRFERSVDRRLDVPLPEQLQYAQRAQQALAQAGVDDAGAQAFVLVDRSPQVQAAMLLLRSAAGAWHWLGAAPVSTGRPGSFDHFTTPLGVFAHTLDNPDFRAEGTFNSNHIRGYGLRGMRVFDFGWVQAERGWGGGGLGTMRLQMHATDPAVLEPRLGRVESKGCIRIPATLNAFIDRHGVLDADYEAARAAGKALWVLGAGRDLIPWPGRYLVVVDSGLAQRPPWAPLPGATAVAPAASSPASAAASTILAGAPPPAPSSAGAPEPGSRCE